MARKVTVHLMFDGVAEEAMNFYVSLFAGSILLTLNDTGLASKGRTAPSR